jgi:GntR family transcriptional regulator
VIVHVDATSSVPPYEQLRTQVVAAIRDGSVEPGHRLPPIRQLAADLDLAPGTVARAYRELEAAGLVESRGRRGTRVVDVPPRPSEGDRQRRLERLADEYALQVAALGAGADDALDAVRRALSARTG